MYETPYTPTDQFDLTNLPVSVQAIVGLVSSGHTTSEIVEAYPFLSSEDIEGCYDYAEFLAGAFQH